MSRRESISRYNLIIRKLRKSPATFKEISDFLAIESELQSYNFSVSKRTFQRDIYDILSIYNIEIRYDFSRKVYFIDFEQQPEINERILEAFDTFNALNISERLSTYIHFEKKHPLGTDNLYGLLHSIKNHLIISFTYHKYWEDMITERTVEPYALKEFRNRWYILANDLKDHKVKTFALDRLTALSISTKKFNVPNEISVAEYFKHCYGIIRPDDVQPQEVILSFDPFQGRYIKSMPLHESQKIIKDNDEELLIQLKLFLTHDFLMELLSYGENVKVIRPEKLISDLKQSYQSALNLY
jgi:predicted DNA-binding transcriptional regulator YafY